MFTRKDILEVEDPQGDEARGLLTPSPVPDTSPGPEVRQPAT